MSTSAARLPEDISKMLVLLKSKTRRSKSYYIVKALRIYFEKHVTKEELNIIQAVNKPSTIEIAHKTGLLAGGPQRRTNKTKTL